MKKRNRVMRAVRSVALLLGPLALLGGCGAESGALEERDGRMSFEQFRALAHHDPATGIYLVDGDMTARNEAQLRDLYRYYFPERSSDPNGPGYITKTDPLIVKRIGSADDRWNNIRQLNITYCVNTRDFHAFKPQVVQAMAEAASAWQRVANVAFQYLPEQDDTCDERNPNVTFEVRARLQDLGVYAYAFYPSDPRDFRSLVIRTPLSRIKLPLTLAGVLRHELAHILGFVHENARPEAASNCFIPEEWRPLTEYDPLSIMHFTNCNERPRADWVLTSLDEQGAALLYGPPPDAGLDVVFYRGSYDDLQATFDFAAIRNHWLEVGLREGRRGSAHFDAAYYLATYPELAATLGADNYRAAWEHWLDTGVAEGRRGSREFDVRYYLENHADLQAKIGTDYAAALRHWLATGLFEGRRGSADFDVKSYLSTNPDLRTRFGDTNYAAALAHAVRSGTR